VVAVLHVGMVAPVVTGTLIAVVGSILGSGSVDTMVLGFVEPVVVGVLALGLVDVVLNLYSDLLLVLWSLSQMAPGIEHLSCILLVVHGRGLACWGLGRGLSSCPWLLGGRPGMA